MSDEPSTDTVLRITHYELRFTLSVFGGCVGDCLRSRFAIIGRARAAEYAGRRG